MRIQEVTKKLKIQKPKDEVQAMLTKYQKEYEAPIKGRFEFTEANGAGTFSFSDRFFPNRPIMVYHIQHGETCIIPKGIARRLNNTVQRVRVQNKEMGESGAIRGVPDACDKFSRVKFIPEDVL